MNLSREAILACFELLLKLDSREAYKLVVIHNWALHRKDLISIAWKLRAKRYESDWSKLSYGSYRYLMSARFKKLKRS